MISITKTVASRRLRCAGIVPRIGETRDTCRILMEKLGKRSLEKLTSKWGI